jgi:hypothetical protein
MLYLEAPAAVGYSVCGDPNGCYFDDVTQADENLKAILKWFDLYPEFQANDFYISGESYAGVYVPYLSKWIYDFNQANINDATVFKPNLTGFIVGNGCTNWTYDCNPPLVDVAFWHSLMSQELRAKMQAANCDYGGLGMPNVTPLCEGYFTQMFTLIQRVDIYNIFGICYGTNINPALDDILNWDKQTTEWKKLPAGERPKTFQEKYTPWVGPTEEMKKKYLSEGDEVIISCDYDCSGLLTYLNRADVRTALHIKEEVVEYLECSGAAQGFHYTKLPECSQWIYEELLGKIRMMHYSGDVDGAVPTDGTEAWIASTGWKEVQPWTRWTYVNETIGNVNQIAGYSTVYD